MIVYLFVFILKDFIFSFVELDEEISLFILGFKEFR